MSSSPDFGTETGSGEAPRRSAARRWITAAILVALLAGIALYISTRHEELASVRRLSLRVLVVASLVQFAAQLFLNGAMVIPLQRCAPALRFWEIYLVRTGGLLVGSVIPVAGGLAVRLAYLRARGVTYLDFTWATLLSNVLALAASALLSIAATGVLWWMQPQMPRSVLAVTAAVVLISVTAMAAFDVLPRVTRHPRFRRWSWLSGVSSWRATPALTMWVFVLSLVRHCLNFVTFGLLARSLSQVPADFLKGGLVYALTSPVRMVNVTPANLGVAEWVVALVGQVLAFDLATGLIVALAYRGIGLVGQGVGVLVGSAWLAASKRS